MTFSEVTINDAWERSGGKCECVRSTCTHIGRCNKELHFESRGSESQFGWEAHHVTADGPDSLSNCEILCQDCHKNTITYGNNQ